MPALRSINLFSLQILSLLLIISISTSVHARDSQLSASLEHHRQSGRLTDNVKNQLDKTGWVDVLVSLDDSRVQELAARERHLRRIDRDDHEILRKKAALHKERKQRLLSTLAPNDHKVLRDYEHFGVLYMKASDSALARLLDDPEVVRIHENRRHELFLAESLPLIGQPLAAGRQYTGGGKTIAILDSGLNYSLPVFGNCTLPLDPSICKVVETVDIPLEGGDDGQLDNVGHGTVVAEIASRVAPGASIISVDIVDKMGEIPDSQIIDGLNWVIGKSSVYDFAAVNLSLGRDSFSSVCDNGVAELALFKAIEDVRAAGIVVVAASGNSGFNGMIAAPACFSKVVSVGATYDASFSANLNYPLPCQDKSPSVDSVVCFTNLSNFLSLFAPGAMIYTTADTSYNHIYAAGTSFATPHVTGAVAVLAAAEPDLTPDQIADRLKATGKPVSSTRVLTNYTVPRLNLDAALLPNMTATPASLDFGTIPVGSVSPLLSINVISNGLGDISISSAALGGSDPAAFEIVDGCTAATLPPYASACSVGVRFLAQSAGIQNAKLTFSSNDPSGPEVLLTGTSADFVPLPPIRLLHAGRLTYYDTAQTGALQSALNAASGGDVLQVRSVGIYEILIIDKSEQLITFEGGFDSSYTNQNDVTTLLGGMVLKSGKVVARNIKIR